MLGSVGASGTTITSPTQLLLLSVLAAAKPDAVPFGRLIDAVWDDPPPSAENSLHSHLTRLRRALGAGSIEREARAYRLLSPTDAERFDALLDVSDRRGDVSRERLEAALALWRGDPFGDHARHRFVRGRAEELRTRWSYAVRELAACDVREGDAAAAVASLHRLAEANPLDETTWSMLVETLAATGRRTEALRAAQDARRHLADVGLEPSALLRAAEHAALRDDSLRTGLAPRAIGPLVGRREELAVVMEAIETSPWTTLIGPGGAGKTRLAIEAMSEPSGAIDDAWFVDLTGVAPDGVVVAVARSVGAALRPPYLERVAAHLATGSAWLVLDCCEHVIGAVRSLGDELLRRCSGLAVIATSRTPVGLSGERLVEIGPLPPGAAGELLQMRARQSGVEPPADDEATALCMAVDCLPLTVELLAAELRSRSSDELLSAVSDPLAALGGPGGALAASVDRSVSTLSRDERESFDHLSLFRGPFVVEVAAACAPPALGREVARDVRVLRDRSLLVQVDSAAGRRLRMLDTVRALGHRSLAARSDREPVERAFVAGMARRTEQIAAGLRTLDEPVWLAIAETELGDIEAAHQLAIALGDAEVATAIPTSMFTLVYDRLRADLATWADRTLEAFGRDHPDANAVAAVAALGAMHADDHDRAWSLISASSEDDVSAADRFGALVAANLHLRSGALDDCASAAQRVVAAARIAGDDYLAVVGHVLQALSACYRGATDAAQRISADVRTQSRRIGAPTLLAYADYVDGEILSDRDPATAAEFLEQARRRAAENRSALAEGVARVTLTTTRARTDDPHAALGEFALAIRHWRDCGDWNLQWSTLRNFVEVLIRNGRHDDAALLAAAVEAHGPPPYGPEAERFATSRGEIERQLDAADLARLRARGRLLTADELLDHAIAAGAP